MEPLVDFSQAYILPPCPGTKRAKRTKWAVSEEGILLYGVNKNLVLRDLNNPKSS